ncbi:hypothetical protein F751_0018 [Auxenochlorella protothecoides]|uniref:Uncharacterized protein n=1 Tax=Auxenochlorella protothecoides TaxID=3075 RepID=A0A087S9Y5_AUXPR|nr:hypothetical protein F751_0018 [Auxenochlorella protothecoides]KFM22539.1 hypothetical protein F751_0018 [Auxenochlorella protothecoides]
MLPGLARHAASVGRRSTTSRHVGGREGARRAGLPASGTSIPIATSPAAASPSTPAGASLPSASPTPSPRNTRSRSSTRTSASAHTTSSTRRRAR